MDTIRFEQKGTIGSIVLANPPFNRLDLRFSKALREAVHSASESAIRVLVVRAEGPNFSFGGEVRGWPGKDVNWFRTFVAEVNASYRAIETLRVPTIAVVRGVAFGGGFELALACDFLVAAKSTVFRCVEVTTAMLPLAGALQRLAERVGRARASRFAMLGEPIPGVGGRRSWNSDPRGRWQQTRGNRRRACQPARQRPHALLRGNAHTLRAWSSGGVAAADLVMLDVTMELYNGADAQRGFANTAKAFNADIEPPAISFEGK